MAAATLYRLALLRIDPAGLAMACQAIELLVQQIAAAAV
jgi:hypothetical protein